MNSATRLLNRPQHRSKLLRSEERIGWLFASPFVIGVLAFWAYPMAYSIYLVFHDWNLISPPKYVGVENIVQLFQDPKIGLSLYNTAFYTFFSVPLQLALALILALALNRDILGRGFYRTILYLPSLTPVVAGAVVWTQIFHPEFGLLNAMLGWFGIPQIRWLNDPSLAKPAFIFMSLWTVGGQMIIFLAGLQSVPVSLYEAAQIDGANDRAQFMNITLPMISPIIFFNLVIGIIGSFQSFTTAFIMTGGGPQDATLFTVLYLYRNAFQYFKMGYASAISWLLFVIIMCFTVLQFRLANRWVYRENVD